MAAPATKENEKATAETELLPAILGDSPIFRTIRDEQMGAVKDLAEAGLTRVAFISMDRKGKMLVDVRLVSFETRDAVLGLLNDEHIG